MIIDNLTGSLICYGISLNCSLDALIFLPLIIYRMLTKVVKQLYRNPDVSDALYQNNELNLDIFKGFLTVLHEASIALVAGAVIPWIPYLYEVGFGSA